LTIQVSVTACLRNLAAGDLAVFRKRNFETYYALNASSKLSGRVVQLDGNELCRSRYSYGEQHCSNYACSIHLALLLMVEL